MNEINCPVCNKIARVQHITKAFGNGDNLLVIENIPVIVCRTCHEHYITAETLHEIEQLRQSQFHHLKMVNTAQCAA